MPETLDPSRRDAIAVEARRLAASAHYATLLEIEQALVDNGIPAEQVHAVFDDDLPLRDEILALAEKAHGVGGGATE